MPRPIRKKLTFDVDSVNKLLQEIYDESHNIKAKINRLFTKWETKAKDTDNIAVLSDSIVKLINAEAKNQDQKIMLLRYLKEVVFDNNKQSSKNADDTVGQEVTSERRNELLDMVRKELDKKQKA